MCLLFPTKTNETGRNGCKLLQIVPRTNAGSNSRVPQNRSMEVRKTVGPQQIYAIFRFRVNLRDRRRLVPRPGNTY